MEYSRNTQPKISVRDQKNELRAAFKERRRALSQEARRLRDSLICRKMLSLAAYRYADTVLSYSPLKGEVDITEFNLAVLKGGKRLALPRCVPNTPIMDFRYVESLDELEDGSWSIKEPSEENELWQSGSKGALCIIPAMAFDEDGYRLGYGKGYYDRFLPSKNLTTLGVVYSDFTVKQLPRGRYDFSVDMILTEKGLINVRP